jgi:hypothetical protein
MATTWTTSETTLDVLSRLTASGSIVNMGRDSALIGAREFDEYPAGICVPIGGHVDAPASCIMRLDTLGVSAPPVTDLETDLDILSIMFCRTQQFPASPSLG